MTAQDAILGHLYTDEERPTTHGCSLAYFPENRTRAPICHTKARARMRAIRNLIQPETPRSKNQPVATEYRSPRSRVLTVGSSQLHNIYTTIQTAVPWHPSLPKSARTCHQNDAPGITANAHIPRSRAFRPRQRENPSA